MLCAPACQRHAQLESTRPKWVECCASARPLPSAREIGGRARPLRSSSRFPWAGIFRRSSVSSLTRAHVSLDGQSDKVRRFEKHILVYLDDLYRVALRLTGQATDAEDLVQETCLRAFKALDQLKHLPAAKVWVFAILRSVFLRQAERRPSRRALISLEDIDASRLTRSEALRDAYAGLLPMRPTLLQETRGTVPERPCPP